MRNHRVCHFIPIILAALMCFIPALVLADIVHLNTGGKVEGKIIDRTADGIRASGADALFVRDTAMLPEDALHSVTNPLQRFTGGIHIYGGDFFDTTRSQWNPETLEEEPSDGAKIREMFRRENERLGLI